MMHTAEQYQQSLLALTPPGTALPLDPDSNWGLLWRALADEFARLEQRGLDLLEEAFAASVTELLEEWERAYGLPDACYTPATTAERVNALVAKVYQVGELNALFFVGLADALGWTAAVTYPDAPFVMGDAMGTPLGGPGWNYVWYVTGSPGTGAAPSAQLECILGLRKPAHTYVFVYEVL